MKYIITILLLSSSTVLLAQTTRPTDPSNTNPGISVTPSINTTVTNQPASMPNSNTNPTTGTVINLKTNKNNSKPKTGIVGSDSLPLKKENATINNSKTNKKKKKSK